jgi:hypothetical protein
MKSWRQFSLRGLIGITTLAAVASLVVAIGRRDPSRAADYRMAAGAVLAASACLLACRLPRGVAGVLGYWLLTSFGVFEFFAISAADGPARGLHVAVALDIVISSMVVWIVKGSGPT